MFLRINLFFVLAVLFSNSFAQSTTITATIKGLANESLLIANYQGDKSKIIDTLFTDQNGFAQKEIDQSNYETGLYKLVVNYDNFIEFIYDGQSINLTASIEDVSGTLEFKESATNQQYLAFLRKHNEYHRKVSLLQKIADSYPDEKFVKTALNEYNSIKKEFETTVKDLSSIKSSFARSLAKARIELAPDLNLPKEERMNAVLENYFSYLDLTDDNLYNSDAYTQKAIGYISMKVSKASQAEQVAVFKSAVDDILYKMSVNKKAYDVVSDYMISGFESMQMTELVNYITDKYLKEQGCNESDRSSTLHRKVRYHSEMKIGSEVYDFTVKTLTKGKISVKDFTDKPLILTFWASWCPHCTTEMPQISDLFNNQKERKFELAMVSLDTVKTDLEKFLKANKMTKQFNICDEKGWDGELAENFNIFSTPTIFVIQNNKILAKPESYAELREFLAGEGLVAW